MVNTQDEAAKLRKNLCKTNRFCWAHKLQFTHFILYLPVYEREQRSEQHSSGYRAAYAAIVDISPGHKIVKYSVRPCRWHVLWRCIKFKAQFHFLPFRPHDDGSTKFVTTSLSVSGYQAVSGGNHQVDQSAWSVTVVQGIGRQVPHGPQVWRPPSYWAIPQLQGKRGVVQMKTSFKTGYGQLNNDQ